MSAPLEALSERLRGAGQSSDASQAAARSKYRLRQVLNSDRVSHSEDVESTAFSQSSPGIVASAPAALTAPATIAEVPKVSLAAASAFGTYPPPAELGQHTQVAEPPTALDPPVLTEAPAPSLEAIAQPQTTAPTAASEQPPKPSVSVEPASATASVLDEPIRTRSMARLLATQGHAKRALAIYDFLLVKTPDDASLRADADALRGQLSA